MSTLVRASEVTFNEGLVRLAAIHGKTVEFRYAKGDGSMIELRALQPATVIVVDPGGDDEHVTFSGFDPDRQQPRHYRLDRMKGDARIAS